LYYFDVAKGVVGNLSNLPIDQEALQALCLAWQWRKGLIKSKKAKGQKYCGMNERDCLEMAVGYLQEDYDVVKEQVYQQLVLRPKSFDMFHGGQGDAHEKMWRARGRP